MVRDAFKNYSEDRQYWQYTITEPEKDRCQKMPVFKASFLVFLVPHIMEGG